MEDLLAAWGHLIVQSDEERLAKRMKNHFLRWLIAQAKQMLASGLITPEDLGVRARVTFAVKRVDLVTGPHQADTLLLTTDNKPSQWGSEDLSMKITARKGDGRRYAMEELGLPEWVIHEHVGDS